MQTTKQRIVGLAFLLLLSFSVGGCIPILSASFQVKIGLQEKWEMNGTLLVSSQLGEQLTNYLAQQFSGSDELQQAGVRVDVKQLGPDQGGNVPVQLTMSGQGYDSFRKVFGDDALEIEEVNGMRILNFRLNIFSGMTAQSTDFTLSGGKIIESNGQQVNETTVQWLDYTGRMTASMQEPSLIDYLPWIIVGGGAILVLFFLILLFSILGMVRKKPATRRATPTSVRHPIPHQTPPGFNPLNDAPPVRRQTQGPLTSRPLPMPPPSQAQFKHCLQCGAQIPAHAVFCPMCGAKQA